MPRFYLHLDGPMSSVEDGEGYEFPDIAAAREEAIGAAMELMASQLRNGNALGLDRSIRITDESGVTVCIVQFREAMPSE